LKPLPFIADWPCALAEGTQGLHQILTDAEPGELQFGAGYTAVPGNKNPVHAGE
jgi:hypothetical protein